MSIESLGGALTERRASRQQCATAVLMIRPAAFDYNPETAATNKMQKPGAHANTLAAGTAARPATGANDLVGETANGAARGAENGSSGIAANAGAANGNAVLGHAARNADARAPQTHAAESRVANWPAAHRSAADSGAAESRAADTAQTRARAEFDHFVRALESEGVTVCAVDDTPNPPKPDAVFPNNWVSFHEDGTLVLYPMQAESRRRERRQDVVDRVVEQLGFKLSRVVDLTRHEAQGRFLEGTGSLVLDHAERVAYACRSPRTDPVVLEEWARELGYDPIVFDATDRNGVPLYHTNVLMCIGARMVVVGSEAIASADRASVLERLHASGREVIEIGHREIEGFAGNMLELATWDEALGDCRVLVMSESARQALRPETFAQLSGCTDEVLAIPVPTIERLGGGSVRCMLAEVFLPS